MDKGKAGVGLICVAVLLAVAALVLWNASTEDAKDAQLAEEFRAAIDSDSPDDIDPNRSGSLTTAGFAGVLFLGGIVLVASRTSGS